MDDIGALLEQYGVGGNWLRCVDCRWVFRNDLPYEFGNMCPRCHERGMQGPFPRVEAWHLIEVVLGHAARLDPDSADQERAMLAKLHEAGLGQLKSADLREMAAQARLRVERGGYDALADVGAELADRGVPMDRAMTLSLELLMVAGQASPDVEAVLVLAATALEALLDELWVETLAAFGLVGVAVPSVAGIMRRNSVPRQRMLLAELCQPSGRFPFDKDFISRWDDILEHRNSVVHGRPFLVSLSCAQEAVRLAAGSVAAFAEANNRLQTAAREALDAQAAARSAELQARLPQGMDQTLGAADAAGGNAAGGG